MIFRITSENAMADPLDSSVYRPAPGSQDTLRLGLQILRDGEYHVGEHLS